MAKDNNRTISAQELIADIDEVEEEESEEVITQKQSMFTTFLLISPSLFLACLSIVNGTIGVAMAAIAVFTYQAIMVKNYIDKRRTY